MTEERLTVIAMHYQEQIPIDKICHTFVQAHPRRLFQKSFETDATELLCTKLSTLQYAR